MSRARTLLLCVSLPWTLCGCPPSPTPATDAASTTPDAAGDGGWSRDAGPRDATPPRWDASAADGASSHPADAATAPPDGSPPWDAGPRDAARPDAGPGTAFGLALSASGLTSAATVDSVRNVFQLNVYRPPAIFLDEPLDTCRRCDLGAQAGLRLVLVIRANGRASPTVPPSRADPTLVTYREQVGAVLDRYPGSVEVLVVENEVDDDATSWAGTAGEYLTQLAAACEVAHARSVPCADSGLSTRGLVTVMTREALDNGENARAVDLWGRLNHNPAVTEQAVRAALSNPSISNEIADTRALVRGLAAAGVDLVNFHHLHRDVPLLNHVIAWLRATVPTVPVFTSELGQGSRTDAGCDPDPQETRDKLHAVKDARLALCVWLSQDIPGRSCGLTGADGVMREAGVAFYNVVIAGL